MTNIEDDYVRLVEAVECIVSHDEIRDAEDRVQHSLPDVSYVAFTSPNRLYVAIQVDIPQSNDPYAWLVYSDDGLGPTWGTSRMVTKMKDDCIKAGMVDVSDEVELIYSTFML